jgi:hypothetical protein
MKKKQENRIEWEKKDTEIVKQYEQRVKGGKVKELLIIPRD